MYRAPLALIVLTLAACNPEAPPPALPTDGPATPEPPVVVDEEPQTLRAALRRGTTLALNEDDGFISVVARRVTSPEREGEAVFPVLQGGVFAVARNEELVLSTMDLSVGDVDVSREAHPPSGLAVRDISIRVVPVEPVRAIWNDAEDAADLEGVVAVRVEWYVEGENGLLPLRPIDLAEVTISGRVAADLDGAPTIQIRGQVTGLFFELPGLVELSDLGFELFLAAPRGESND